MTASDRSAGIGATLAIVVAMLFWGLVPPASAQEQQSPEIPLEAVQGQIQQKAGGSVRPPADAVTNAPAEPGMSRERDFMPADVQSQVEALRAQGPNSDAAIWGEVRHGGSFTTQASNPQSDFLVQDGGMAWQQLRSMDGALLYWGTIALFSVLALLFVFFLFRGRIEVEHGMSGRLIERFKPAERFGHWLLAISFILLAVTGLNLLYGKDLLLPLIGPEAFAMISNAGKWIHNNVAWPFMLALVWIFVFWVWHNLPSLTDLRWLAVGGGLFTKGVHPPSKKFNAGQKLIFWSTIILGGSISASGLSLLFPFELPMFAGTFQVLTDWGVPQFFGITVPTELTPIEEMQYAQAWHTIVAFAMIVIIIAHIYIGSVGMEGAFDAMGDGHVDRNWALEHHNLWVEEEDARAAARDDRRGSGAASPTPAE